MLLAGVAVNHRVAGLAARRESGAVQIEGNVLETGLFQHPRDILADPAETADHHVIALGDGRESRWASRMASVCEGPDSPQHERA